MVVLSENSLEPNCEGKGKQYEGIKFQAKIIPNQESAWSLERNTSGMAPKSVNPTG